MASRSTAMGMTLGAMGAASLVGTAFVAPTAPSAAPALRGSGAASGQGASGIQAAAASAVASAALALAAGSRRAARNVSSARLAEATGTTSEKPFAGGLIGGESAFAGQDFNFDPLGLSVKCEKYLPWFRESELKHGRIAMLAWVGLVVPEFVRIPGPEACYGAKNVVDAHNACVGNPPFPFLVNTGDFFAGNDDQTGPLFQVYAFCGFIEMLTTFAKSCNVSNKPGLTLETAGDYKLGTNFLPEDPVKAKEMRLKELKNGRLAMLAFGGAITQATLTGNGFPWLYAQKEESRSGFGASVAKASGAFAAGHGPATRSNVARQAGYKMSAAVPFLPMSPALEGIPGEEEGFDPMGFSLAFEIGWLREAELKHGRVAMLATVGWIATDLGLRVPGDAFQVSTIEAHDAMVKFGGMPQILIWCGLLEVLGLFAYVNMREGKTDRKPGDFGLRGFYPSDPKGQYDMQVKELRNGRLAMLAYSGIVTSAVLTQDKWPFFDVVVNSVANAPQASKGSAFCGAAAPQRAGARTVCQASASKSLPFLPKPANLGGLIGGEAEFDPIGFSDIIDIKWLRESELKHGRVCMLATVGFVAEQYWQLPGFDAAPDALQAVWVAPANATGVLLFLAGYIESASYGGKITMLDMFEGDGASRAPGDLDFGKKFLPNDKAAADDLALKELTNGRLAMLAFSGMVHHNLIVKGPLFPLFPEGYEGPQGSWDVDSVAGALNSGRMGL
ncbi:FCP [Symbiodinium pilosum]|uniref:FCP protein n=1 Tax=Symbiodinium pilosum TaxID=2952 RepID=A0A812JA22_SYMPI|nr:FCP [Symbiodinium pilosum]